MNHDFVWLFTRFWWLIFPIFWMLAVGFRIWLRHARANRTLDIIKTYADQGKDPPVELLKTLQGGPDIGGCGPGRWRHSPERRLHRTFLFGALAIAFAVLFFNFNNGAPWGNDWPGHHHHGFGFLIPMMIFAALFLSNLLSLLFAPRLMPPSDTNGPRP